MDMIKVIKILKKTRRNISAVIIGDGVFLGELKNEIKKRNLEKNITITGFLGSERYIFLQQSRIFVSPTYAKEGFGLTLLEALFFNVPIIAYSHPVFEEVFSCFDSVTLIEQNKNILSESILKSLLNKKRYSFNLDMYSLINCVKREKNILDNLIKD